jgi:hypothetical protein
MPKKIAIGPLQLDEPKEIRDTVNAIRPFGLRHQIGFRPEVAGNGIVRFYLSGGVPVTSGGLSYFALPLIDDAPIRFWFAVDLQFETSGGRSTLQHLSILVFGGVLTTDTRRILRAEWDMRATQHAQPHWHVYGSELTELFYLDSAESKMRLDINRFHFAMSARWMDDDGEETNHNISPTAGGVKRWIAATLAYSQKQLRYVAERSPKSYSHEITGI